jgi:hypothetical protein
MGQYFDRYKIFRENGFMKPVPGINITESSSDKTFVYKKGESRLDKVSNDYYNNAYSGWLIMLGNPEYGGLEFMIPDNAILRIPFPYDSAVQSYIDGVKRNINLYGK